MSNDPFGYATGDEVLKHVASTCGSILRDGDLFRRPGGEEFAATLPGSGEVEATRIARRLQQRLARDDARMPELGDEKITVCVGVAECYAVAAPLEVALRRADAALYAGKRVDGDRIVAADAPDIRPAPAQTFDAR